MQKSEFVERIAACQAEVDRCRRTFRALTASERAVLSSRNTSCDATWSNVRVHPATTLEQLRDRIVHCFFGEDVYLGLFTGTQRLVGACQVPTGVYGTRLSNCVIMDDALVTDTTAMSDCAVSRRAIVLGCGLVSGSGMPSTFFNGEVISVGAEMGGRSVPVLADLPFTTAALLAGRPGDAALHAAHREFVRAACASISCSLTIIDEGARLLRCPKVRDAFVGMGAELEFCNVETATILSLPDEVTRVSDGAHLRRCIVQWGASVETGSIVQDSLLCEHSHVSLHGKVLGSILGPNSGVAEGECSSSLVGPFVGFHHQSLLIASYWPEGRGNVGYGANVGSNHTGKAPDQELWPGEGVFFGLGTSIKFPANFTRSPYSLVATGVVSLPQKMEMPFSLVNVPDRTLPELSPAFNQVFPGWVLNDCFYTLVRNEQKFAARNKARRMQVDAEILRPDIAKLLHTARARLIAAAGTSKLAGPDGEPLYTDRQVKGLGKNYCTESARVKGIRTYTRFLRLYALRGLRRVMVARGLTAATVHSLGGVDRIEFDERWQHELSTLREEFGETSAPPELAADSRDRATPSGPARLPSAEQLLELLVEEEKKLAALVETVKSRDDDRGPRIIPDYAATHTPAAEDKVVLLSHRLAAEAEAEVKRLLARL